MDEIWKPIPGHEEFYEASTHGRIRSSKRGRWGRLESPRLLSIKPNGKGYPICRIDGKNYRVHVLVMRTFVGPYPEGTEISHLDDNKTNNHLNNLKYESHEQNMQRLKENGIYTGNPGESNPSSLLSDKETKEIALLHGPPAGKGGYDRSPGAVTAASIARARGYPKLRVSRAIKRYWSNPSAFG